MSPSEQVNPVRNIGFQQQKLQNNLTELLQKSVKDFSGWPAQKQALAISAVGAVTFMALPVLAVALPFAATGAVVGLALFLTVNAVSYAFKGLKYVAKGAVKGVVYLKNKVVDGFGSLKGGISAVGSTMKEGTSDTLKKVGRKLSGLGESMGDLDSIPYSTAHKDKGVTLLEEEKTKKFSSVREMFFEEIFQDKISNKSALVKKVFSKIGSKIAEKAYLVPNQGINNSKLINQLEEQADFIKKLDAKKLKNLLAENNHDPQLYKIFSEHHDEIKSIIKECKEEQTRLNAAAEVRGRSKSAPAQPTSSLSESSSLNSVSTDDSEERRKVKSKFWSLSRLGRSAKETKEKIQEQPSSGVEADFTRFATTRANRNPSQAPGPIPVEPPKPPKAFMTRSNSSGSLASTDSYVSAMSDSESTKSFSAFQEGEIPKAPSLPLDGKIPTMRSESPSADSGVSSAGSANGRNSPNPSIKHTGPQVPVNPKELYEKWNSLTKIGSLEKLVPPKSQADLPKVQHPASKAPDVPSNSSRCAIQ